MLISERTGSTNDYRYGFQGQEKDNEIKGEGNSYNFTYRMHDPRVGRFFTRDPLEKDYPHYTPYSFSGNKVIHAIELEGLEEVLVNPKLKPKDQIIVSGATFIKDKTAVHIVAHGSQSSISNDLILKGDKKIDTAKEFTAIVEQSNDYEVLNKIGTVTVVLHACRTGRPISKSNGDIEPSIAQRMSQETDFTIIAPDERDYFTDQGEKGPMYTKHTDDTNRNYLPGTTSDKYGKSTGKHANWKVYTEGVLTSVYEGNWVPKGKPTLWDRIMYKKDFSFTVNSSTLNLRSGAGTDFSKIGDPLKKGDKLTPTGEVKDGWAKVNTTDDRTGWVKASYLKENIE